VEIDELELLVSRALEAGVPKEITAQVFELPVDVVAEMLHEVRVRTYNTADRAEYLEHLQWEVLRRAEETIRTGSPGEAARIATAVLGRQIAVAGKRPSEGLEGARAEILSALGGMRESGAAPVPVGRFVVGNADAGRRADEDSDEGD
jgi:hypothetical protein